MNAKTSARKTKTPAAGVAAKPKQVSTAAGARKQPAVTPASAQTRKSAAATRAKATARSASVAPPVPATPILAGKSKQARLIEILRAKPGATIDQMMTLTGWQAHTVRGTISGVLRKKLGLNVTCVPSTDSATRRYRIVGGAVGA